MGWYLKFPSDSGNSNNNKALCQISGISGTLQSVRYKLAESIPSLGSYRYIFDIRRAVDLTADDGGTGWILQTDWVQTAGTSNFKINNSPVDASALFAGAADDVCSFDVNQDPRQGCIAFGCRFNEVESNYGLSVYYIEIVDSAGTHTIDMSSSGGSASEFASTDGAVTLKLFNFTGSAHWVFYSSGGTSFTGTIGKTTLTPTTQALSINAGAVLSSGLSTLTPSNKQLGVVAGVSLGVGKQALVLNTKSEFVQAGAVVTNGKQAYPLATKQLSVVVGANVPFTATINKSSYSLSGKQLAVQAGWNNSVSKDVLTVQGKQESVNAGALFNINEQQLTLSKKGLSLVTGTSISFIGELNKANLNAVGKPLSVVTGTSIPFTGTIQKTSLTLSGKALTRTNGHILEIQKQSLNLVNKQLSIGETIYPIIPVERLFTIKDGDRMYLMKQTTTIYIMKNN